MLQIYPKTIVVEGYGPHYSGKPVTYGPLLRACEIGEPIDVIKEDDRFYYVEIDGMKCQFGKDKFQTWDEYIEGGKKNPIGYEPIQDVRDINVPEIDPFDDDPFND